MASDPMFPGSETLGSTVEALFDTGNSYQQINLFNHLMTAQDEGVNRNVLQGGKANVAQENSPQYGNEKNKPTTTEDPQAVEERWTARMAKYAGIAQATGTKI